jgi:leucyl-tRNA synthetase
MTNRYDHRTVEAKWQKRWQEEKIYQPDVRRAKKPYYNLMMFPYPSAEGLHVGNMYAFTGADIYGRFQRMRGFDVFEPIGLDGFGIHSENYAIKIKKHPANVAKVTEKRFYEQLATIGNSFAWGNRLETYDPEYYKWTQWIFIQLFKKGLAYRGIAKVNWCPTDKTVLADEQVIAGCCERCGSNVELKELEQWFFKITAYADRLLANLEKIDWSEKVKMAQKNWIGKREGAEIKFRVSSAGQKRVIGDDIWVFTTRPDTLYGATFIVLAPDHPLASVLAPEEQEKMVTQYIARAKQSARKNQEEKDKEGVFTGAFATNLATGHNVPIWIATYVVSEYGTGAVMGVPAHDERDYNFAKAHKLRIINVIAPYDTALNGLPYPGEGTLVRSGMFSDLASNVARTKIVDQLAKTGQAKIKTTYRLRDWLISRQRYWGPPIPMVHCPTHGWVPEKEENLPVLLPETNEYLPSKSGKTPLGRVNSFLATTCPMCGKKAVRSDEVSDTFLDSAWYFLRYPSVHDHAHPWNPDITKKWLPVDMYIGGAEHSVLHLLYSRFLTMVFSDMGLTDFDEPFPRFRAHGLLIREGAKMSKSKGNVIIPDTHIKTFGADAFRTYLMFLGPYDQGGNFQDKGITGVARFLKRVWFLTHDTAKRRGAASEPLLRALHATVKKVSADIPALKYNTAIAALMELTNAWEKRKHEATSDFAATFLQLLAPFAPHMTEELWRSVLKMKFSIHQSTWPTHDDRYLFRTSSVIALLVDGKVRDQMEVSTDTQESAVVSEALARPKIRQWVPGKPRRTVYVPGRILNLVTKA